MRVILLGAGASKSYSDSKTNVRMPVANDFFETYQKLRISENPWVLIGSILNYVQKFRGINIEDFGSYNGDIEDLHSEIEANLLDSLSSKDDFFSNVNDVMFLNAYNQLIFLFTSVINEIQNGPISKSHISLANQLNGDDIVITFNWDTLMDRALNEVTNWNTTNGYYVKPRMIYRDKWESIEYNDEKNDFSLILKLHGSSNWLTSHWDKELKLIQEISPSEFFIYESNDKPYSTHDGRYMEGYEDFSYGYYPPNLPLKGRDVPEGMVFVRATLRNPFTPKGKSNSSGLISMPLIIPPVKKKEYNKFGSLFSNLWDKAQESIQKATQIVIIGYSFPKTDVRSNDLFKTAFLKRTDMPEIIILNPEPEQIAERFQHEFGITDDKLKVIKDYFTEDFDLSKII